MIWNPWKEIKRLRGQVDLYNEMAMDAGQKVVFLQSDKEVLQGRIDALVGTIDRHENGLVNMSNTLLAIIAEEKPTSNATVKRICKIAREALAK